MDYDQTDISSRYDAARSMPTKAISGWMDRVARAVPPEEVSIAADIGCGTGRFSGALRDRFAARMIGLDPSSTMLREANRKLGSSGLSFLRSTAECLPLSTGAVDLAFMSMVYHHLSSARVVARELHRIVRPSGYLCIRNSLVDHLDLFVHLQYFPTARTHLESVLPTRKSLLGQFVSNGFEAILVEDVELVFAESFAELEKKIGLRAQSELVSISTSEFEAGLAKMKEARSRWGQEAPIKISVGLFVFRRA